MRFTTAFFAVAMAATAMAATETTASTPSSTVSIDPVQSSIQACNNACKDGDVACKAKCNPVPNPSREQVQETHDCIAACPQGKGTKSDQDAYASCTSQCILNNYYDAKNGGTPDGSNNNSDSKSSDASATGSDSASATGTDKADSTATGTDKASSSATGTESSSSKSTDNAGSALVGSSAALFGAVVAALAL